MVFNITPNFESDWSRARTNYAEWLHSTGNTCTVRRPATDVDGISTGQPGTTNVVHTGIPFATYPFGSDQPPYNNSRMRRESAFVPGGVRVSVAWGTDIRTGDEIEEEPVGTGLTVIEITGVQTGDADQFDDILIGATRSLVP